MELWGKVLIKLQTEVITYLYKWSYFHPTYNSVFWAPCRLPGDIFLSTPRKAALLKWVISNDSSRDILVEYSKIARNMGKHIRFERLCGMFMQLPSSDHGVTWNIISGCILHWSIRQSELACVLVTVVNLSLYVLLYMFRPCLTKTKV